MTSRLSLAIEAGLTLPDTGRVLVSGPKGDADLSALPSDRLHLVQGFRPDFDALEARGLAVSAEPEGDYAAAVVVLPRAKEAARERVAEAAARLPEGAPLVIVGQKTDGVEGLLREIRKRAGVDGVLSKAHGKVFWLGAQGFPDWLEAARPRRTEDGYVTRAGVFSADGPDPGSRLLAEALPAKLPARVADFGGGWGYLSAQALVREGIESLDLYEADHAAVECARANLDDPRVRVHWSDVTALQAGPFDAILCNPPFHTSRQADPALGVAFLTAAARCLSPGGTLWLVANRHLPYERALSESFAQVAEIGGTNGYKLFTAARPRTAKRPRN